MKKRLLSFIIFVFMLSSITSCKKSSIEDINILFTTDVHCGIEDNLGYSSVKAYKDYISKSNKYVTMVDSGDAIQGGLVGSISKGEYIIDIMNEVGYDLFTIGNHEFDYGMDVLQNDINKFNGDVLSCNFKYIGNSTNKFESVKPYEIIKYGNKKVGYVGVTTPTAFTTSNPELFKEDGEFAYSFTNETVDEFYNCIQENIDICKDKECDYIILLSHVGYGDAYPTYGSLDLIKELSGVTAIIDGHSHKDINCSYQLDKDNKYVPVCNAGTKLKELGRLVITKKGNVLIEFINEYNEHDETIDSIISDINVELNEIGNKVVARSNIDLKIYDSDGIRMVRNRETAIGNLVADAYRITSGANISFVNGGGVRDNILAGDITYNNLKAVHPFGNKLMVVEATGSQIRDYLEFASKNTKSIYKDSNGVVGEFGGFANVSGLKYSINTSIESSVEVDSSGMFVSVNGDRRVFDIKVLENGEYKDLELDKTYTIASHNYLIKSAGDGCNMFKNCRVIDDTDILDYEVLITYIMDYLNSDLSTKYSSIEGRINII